MGDGSVDVLDSSPPGYSKSATNRTGGAKSSHSVFEQNQQSKAGDCVPNHKDHKHRYLPFHLLLIFVSVIHVIVNDLK